MQNENHYFVVITKLNTSTVLSLAEIKIFQYKHFRQIWFMKYVKPLTHGRNKKITQCHGETVDMATLTQTK